MSRPQSGITSRVEDRPYRILGRHDSAGHGALHSCMKTLIHELLTDSADRFRRPVPSSSRRPKSPTLSSRAQQEIGPGIDRYRARTQERVAVYLPKRPETVASIFGATMAGCVFVPVNPLLKPPQVGHILRDCSVRVLVTTAQRLGELAEELGHAMNSGPSWCLTDRTRPLADQATVSWDEFLAESSGPLHRVIDTGHGGHPVHVRQHRKAKRVVLSHRNMVTGARSVAQYLENTSGDRLLALLPLSFDYGFSQLATAFHVGASVVLMDYLFPRDVLNLVVQERITGLAAVPPVWIQLAELEWPATVTDHLRYITNSGGAMPKATLGNCGPPGHGPSPISCMA